MGGLSKARWLGGLARWMGWQGGCVSGQVGLHFPQGRLREMNLTINSLISRII